MKLSEAILLGSTLSKQGFLFFRSADGSRCALGAALDAAGLEFENDNIADGILSGRWPVLNDQSDQECPECGQLDSLCCIIMHLNDTHKVSREQIAEWVASVEPQEKCADVGQGPGVLSLEETAV